MEPPIDMEVYNIEIDLDYIYLWKNGAIEPKVLNRVRGNYKRVYLKGVDRRLYPLQGFDYLIYVFDKYL